MANTLQLYFPQLRTRQQVLDEIYAKESMLTIYEEWGKEEREQHVILQIYYSASIEESAEKKAKNSVTKVSKKSTALFSMNKVQIYFIHILNIISIEANNKQTQVLKSTFCKSFSLFHLTLYEVFARIKV